MVPSLAGLLADFDLPQVLMMLETSQVTGVLSVQNTRFKGSVYCEDGRIVHAAAGVLSGEIAVYEIISWEEGEFRFTKDVRAPQQDVDRSSQGLCLEAMRLLDESANQRLAFGLSSQGRDIGHETGRNGANGLAGLEKNALEALKSRSRDQGGVCRVADVTGLSRIAAYHVLEGLEAKGLVVRHDVNDDTASIPIVIGAGRIRVLVVDDSVLMQKVLKRAYEAEGDVEVVGMAANGKEALEMLPQLQPDVISLDLYMPVMDGVTTLKHIMLSQPTPTVVVTSANPEDLEVTFESILRFGALDFITKPSQSRGSMEDQSGNILERIRKAAKVNLRGVRMFQPPPRKSAKRPPSGEARGAIIASGGTGGCLSYMQLLTSLPVDLPFAVVGLLSFPEEFLRGLVSYLRKCATFDVQLASDGAPLRAGVCYLAATNTVPRIDDGGRTPRLRLAAPDEAAQAGTYSLFMDAVRVFRNKAVGLVLSGDGEESFAGLAAVRAAGGITLAQLPASCVDPEQPGRATEKGLIDRVVVLPHISNDLSQMIMSRLRQSVTDRPRSAESEASWLKTA